MRPCKLVCEHPSCVVSIVLATLEPPGRQRGYQDESKTEDVPTLAPHDFENRKRGRESGIPEPDVYGIAICYFEAEMFAIKRFQALILLGIFTIFKEV